MERKAEKSGGFQTEIRKIAGFRGRFEEEENDRWEYVNQELIENGESPVLGVSGYDRVIWARGTPINMVRVR